MLDYALTTGRWLTSARPNATSGINLFFFPYAGAGTSMFRQWQSYLAPGINAHFVHLPGREQRIREKLHTQLVPLVQELEHAILPHLDAPFAFFGHSMGALISFELARQLRRNGHPMPQQLFLSAYRAPQIPDTRPTLHTLNNADFAQQMQYYASLPAEILQDEELLQLFLPILRADFTLCETYHYLPEAPLPCPLSIFGGTHDTAVSHDELLGWQVQTTNSCTLQIFPGDHLYLHNTRQELAQALCQDLQRPTCAI